MKKLSVVVIFTALVFFLQATPYGEAASDNCPDVTSTLPGLTSNCNAFFNVCVQAYSDAETYCADNAQIYVRALAEYKACTSGAPGDFNCSSFDAVATLGELRLTYQVLVPGEILVSSSPPDAPPEAGDGSSSSTSGSDGDTPKTTPAVTGGGGSGGTPRNSSLDYTPLAPFTQEEIKSPRPVALDTYLPFLFNLLLGLSALLAIVMIVIGGVTYITTDVFSQKGYGKSIITNALYGLLMVISSYMILYTINPDLLSFKLYFDTRDFNKNGWGILGLPSAPGGGGGVVFITPECKAAGNCGRLSGLVGGVGSTVCAGGNTACSPEAITTAGLPWEQAVVMSCIAMTENGGGSVACSGTGPCGTFQISQENWGLFATESCGRGSTGSERTSWQNNAECNLQTMVALVRARGYQPWTGTDPVTGSHWNKNAVSCVNNFK